MNGELEESLKRMQKILREHSIVMAVDGCGCCGSPGVYFEYKGEPIVYSEKFPNGTKDDCNFNMRDE